MLILIQAMLTIVTLGYSAIPALADFNKTHATNPVWVPHARFHVVWQVSSYLCFAAIALVLVWAPGPVVVERLWLVAALAGAAYGGFFAAVFFKPVYGGANYDQNGVLPVRGPFNMELDVNITIFTIMSILLAGTVACLGVSAA
jgi:hypothetical protein